MGLETALHEIDRLKSQIEALGPLPAETLASLREDWEVVHTYNSNAIEGNTLTLGETKAVLLDGITISGKPLREHLEAVNHREAMRLMFRMAETSKPVTESDVLELHRVILTGIQSDEAGMYRCVPVRVAGSMRVFPNALKVAALMAEMLRDINETTRHPVQKAARAHYGLVAIHPFVDGNGRTARLLMNLLLLRAGYAPALLQVTERARYYDTLEAANQGEIEGFDRLIAEAVLGAEGRILDILTSTRS